MNGWEGNDARLAAEAMRVVPAIAAARIDGDLQASLWLISGYKAEADSLGIPMERGWLILSTAALKWVTRMMHREAIADSIAPREAAERAIAAAVDWEIHGY